MKFVTLENGQKAIDKNSVKSVLHNYINVLGERSTITYNTNKQAYTLDTFLQMCKDYISADKGTRQSSIETAKQIIESNVLTPPTKQHRQLTDFDKKILQALNFNPKKI